ncbi:DUF3302 domain-containing protein [Enterobacter kobei]|uniref:DUF3302 domain-containing protein n=1 Tax=Enterobacter kobei TaxID=208224 RepID=UPI00068107BA|nr:DUF3302 domain-containing protein [Enterobacter kobei]
MLLDYFALGLLFFVCVTIFYGVIVIHDIPYMIAKKRHHPHADAIHVAGWVSLFTLHILWPFLWIWATLYQPERGWGMQDGRDGINHENEVSLLKKRIAVIESTLSMQSSSSPE